LCTSMWNELAPTLPTLAGAGSFAIPAREKYEAAARVAGWRSLEPRNIADLLLRAAWRCVDEGDVEAERFFRRKVAWMIEAALDSYDGVLREERAVLTYLVGELWRRIGDTRQAEMWLEKVPGEGTDAISEGWIIHLAHQQRHCPREWLARSGV
jgi:uncharacterized protein